MSSTSTSTSSTTPRPSRVDTGSLREWLSASDAPRVLDVRSPAEFETAHIPGSYNVPLHLLREHRDELVQHLDQDVVLVCRSGQRAGVAEESLAGAGLPNLHVLDGGIMAWQQGAGPLNRGRARWDLERQVRLVAGTLVLLGVAGSLVLPGLQWLSAAIGAGLAVAALTDTCAMGAMLARLPYNRGASCDIQTVVRQLDRAAVGTRS